MQRLIDLHGGVWYIKPEDVKRISPAHDLFGVKRDMCAVILQDDTIVIMNMNPDVCHRQLTGEPTEVQKERKNEEDRTQPDPAASNISTSSERA